MRKQPNSAFDVDEAVQERFASHWLLLGIVMVVIISLVWLAPEKTLDRLLSRGDSPTPASLRYLRLLAQEHPNSIEHQSRLANQLIAIGEYQEALEVLENLPRQHPQVLAIYLKALEHAYFEAEAGSSLQTALAAKLEQLAKANHDPKSLAALAKTAAALGQSALAVDCYRRLLFLSTDSAEKAAAFQAAVEGQLATGQPEKALQLALEMLPQITPDAETFRFLARLSLMAGNAECAAHFARLLVGIHPPSENRCAIPGQSS